MATNHLGVRAQQPAAASTSPFASAVLVVALSGAISLAWSFQSDLVENRTHSTSAASLGGLFGDFGAAQERTPDRHTYVDRNGVKRPVNGARRDSLDTVEAGDASDFVSESSLLVFDSFGI